MSEEQERLAVMETKLDNLEHVVFGNGKPGLQEQVTKIVTGLEFVKWMLGSVIGIGILNLLNGAHK